MTPDAAPPMSRADGMTTVELLRWAASHYCGPLAPYSNALRARADRLEAALNHAAAGGKFSARYIFLEDINAPDSPGTAGTPR